jgi:hypothetical protein
MCNNYWPVRPAVTGTVFFLFAFMIITGSIIFPTSSVAAVTDPNTIIVSAEGLADPNSDLYKRDKGLMVDDLRRDAKRQVIEKALGAYVESSTLVENYELISDRILTKSQGLIKRVIKETPPQLGEDGFMHMLLKAEVFLADVKEALDVMSKESRINLVKEHGNPTISVAITARDSARGSEVNRENSPIAENILKEHFVNFGYRVWSEDYTKLLQRELSSKTTERRVADFSVLGEAKFKQNTVTLKASGLTITKHILSSWTVKCINNHTGEEIYFNNKIPRNKSWSDEDRALEDIGRMIGKEFSKDFFELHIMKPSRIMQVNIVGLPDYDTGLLFKKEFIGLRSILNVNLRNFAANGLTEYEIEFAGSTGNFAQIINNTMIKPINAKLGGKPFQLQSHHGEVVNVAFKAGGDPAKIIKKMKTMPPASLAAAAPSRIKNLVKDEKLLEKVASMNKQMAAKANEKQAAPASSGGSSALDDF